jgi:hypothetical protein
MQFVHGHRAAGVPASLVLIAMLASSTEAGGARRLQCPPARTSPALAYDASKQVIVMFGGSDHGIAMNDTWTWDGTTWTLQAPDRSPPGRDSASMTYDAARHEIVLFGGFNSYSAFGDTWIWDGSTWERRQPPTAPSKRSDAASTYDLRRREVVLFGGFGQLDMNRRGSVSTGSDPDGSWSALGDTWTWDGTMWTRKEPPVSPSARYLSSMTYDVARRQAVLFGGQYQYGYLKETWTWDGETWLQHLPEAPPKPRTSSGLAYDKARQEVVLFGGYLAPRSGPDFTLDDTWTWNGSTWTQEHPGTTPPARWSPGLAYDAARRQVVLFGGSESEAATLGDTWTWDGVTWTHQVPSCG